MNSHIRTRPRPRRFRTVASYALAISITIVLAEVFLRLSIFLPFGHQIMVNDPRIGLRVVPGEMGSNSQGFRDTEHALSSAPDILFVGDSFLYGRLEAGPPFPQLVGDILARRVANLAVPASGPPEYARVVETYTRGRGSARAVVLGLYLGNDIHQSDARRVTRAFAGNARMLPTATRIGLLRHDWYLWRVGEFLFRQFVPGPSCATPGAPSPRRLHFARGELSVYRAGADFEDSYRNLARILSGIAKSLQANGIALLVIVQPTQIQIDPDFRHLVAACLGEKAANLDVDSPRRRVLDDLAKAGIAALDLTPAFSDKKTGDFFLANDTHWNADGNRLVAEANADYLRARGPFRAP